MSLNGNTDITNGYNSVIKNGESSNINLVKAVLSPIGTIHPWLKTFGEADSGTTDGTTTDKLVDSSQNFTATVKAGMIVHNTTDDTFAYVSAIDDDSTLSLAADPGDGKGSGSDIFVSGENYIIYQTPSLPDGWLELNGQTISDSDSPYNGVTLPDVNGENKFLRANSNSTGTGGAATHTLTVDEMPSHTHDLKTNTSATGGTTYPAGILDSGTSNTTFTAAIQNTGGGSAHNNEPQYHNVVMIMRYK